MDKLKGNTFIVGMAVVSLATVGVFVFFVLGAWSRASTAEQQLLGKSSSVSGLKDRKDLPGNQWKSSADKYLESILEERKKCIAYYREADRRLERWLEKLGTPPDGTPSQGDLKTELATGISNLKSMLAAVQIEVGYPKAASTGFGGGGGGTEETGGFVIEDAIAGGDMKTMMKHFWIQEHIAKTSKAASIARLEKITFPAIKVDATGPATTPEMARKEAVGLPLGIGEYWQFRVELQCKNQDVPAFLALLFKFDPKESYCLRIRDWNISQTKEGIQALPDRVTKDVPETEKESWKPPPSPVQNVRLVVTGDVLDFDITNEMLEPPAPAQ